MVSAQRPFQVSAQTPLRDAIQTSVAELAQRWWTLALRGVGAVVFGIICFAVPTLGFLALVSLFGAYALVDGAFNLVLAARTRKFGGRRWGWLIAEGVLSIVAAGITLFWPAITGLALVLIVGAWALATGISEIATAIRLRKELTGEWMMGLMGVLSIALGVGFLAFPGAGALAMVFWIGAYALIFGVLLLLLAVRLRGLTRRRDRTEPSAGVATPA